MTFRKILTLLLALLFSASLVLSQSLVEIAKKERERRARLKGKKVTVVTNADLRRVKKKTAVSVIKPQTLEEEVALETEPIPESLFKKEESPQSKNEEEKIFRESKASLEESLKKAKELVSLLEMKINGLWQEFNSLDDMTSRDKIQQEMNETQLKLKKAQEDEAKAKEELEKFLEQAKKKGIPPGWLR